MDNEAAENTPTVRKFCNDRGIVVANLPPYLAHLLDICDNPLHGIIERYVNKCMERFDRPGPLPLEERYEIYLNAYNSIDS